MRRSMRVSRASFAFAVCGFLGSTTLEAGAQAVVGGPIVAPYRVSNYFAAPGYYGTSYGFASFGVPRTYTTFSAFPGPAYGVNYPAYGVLPGRYGTGLWRRGYVAPGYVYGAPAYGTFPVGRPVTGVSVGQIAPPPIGVYAPRYGPGFGPRYR
jgi:hypothetical protein